MSTAALGKKCCCCGKDLTHQWRFRDKAGYWCAECDRWDRRQRHAAKAAGTPLAPLAYRAQARRSIFSADFAGGNERYATIGAIVGMAIALLLILYTTGILTALVHLIYHPVVRYVSQ